MTSFLLLLAYVLFVTFKILYDPLWDWVRGAFIVTSLIFDIELTYSIFFVYFLACKTKRWSQILQVDERNPNVLQDNIGITLVERLFNIYEEILDTIALTKEAVQFTTLLHIVIVFIQSLTYIEILIMMTQNQRIEPVAVTSHAFGVGIWISKAVLTETTFCIVCEMLYRRIVSTQILAVTLKNYYSCRDARRFLKNIQRLYKVQFEKLKIYGIFTIDAALPLRLGRLIADYTVILLQFAFLRN
ncbi:unnamed protein product [Parnassius mnemosyne]|uniref:Gustatory receptor n=1 Tax=Parnassius mnemosyne TaxID=213953 RepID=A0AAV1L7V7_9NEOP